MYFVYSCTVLYTVQHCTRYTKLYRSLYTVYSKLHSVTHGTEFYSVTHLTAVYSVHCTLYTVHVNRGKSGWGERHSTVVLEYCTMYIVKVEYSIV